MDGDKKKRKRKKRRSKNKSGLRVRDAWSIRRTMNINIHDYSHLDVINWTSLPDSFLPEVRPEESDPSCLKEADFVLWVEPDDTIAAVKAYIQEEKGISFKKQKLLMDRGDVLQDSQTLSSMGITDGSTLVLRYAPVTQTTVKTPAEHSCKLMYFHPDNMSSEDKMKLELQTVTDEFKMSESDCGSARVQAMDGDKKKRKRKKRRSKKKSGLRVRDAWSVRRTMNINIEDYTHLDVINWTSLPDSFLPEVRPEESDLSCLKKADFVLWVEPDDTIAAVKAYIQEEKGISVKKQKLLMDRGVVLQDSRTLSSMGITDGSTLVLRYAPVTQITVKIPAGRSCKIMVEADDTGEDVMATIQEKEGIRHHRQRLFLNGHSLARSESLADCGISDGSELELFYSPPGY